MPYPPIRPVRLFPLFPLFACSRVLLFVSLFCVMEPYCVIDPFVDVMFCVRVLMAGSFTFPLTQVRPSTPRSHRKGQGTTNGLAEMMIRTAPPS